MHFKTFFSKIIFKLLPEKIDFKIFISKIHFKIAPLKNAFQNYCLSSIVIEDTRTLLFFSQKILKRKKNKSNFKQT